MSKLIYLCYRDGIKQHLHTPGEIHHLSKRLSPDNITPNPPLIIQGHGILIGVFNPTDDIPVKNHSVCLGQMFGPGEDWWRPGAEAPDGTYAIFRGDDTSVELLSDMVASRTIWYVKTEELFIASTSQRAIIFLLRSFEPNKDVYPWMLSSGTLGPWLSWDRRIQCLKGDSRLLLDRSSWKITITRNPVKFEPLDIPDHEHKQNLLAAIQDTFDHIDLDLKKWLLPLSGGVDSRALLLMLKGRPFLKTITWGLRSSLSRKNNDAYVAKKLAEHFNVEHNYYPVDISSEDIERIFKRYLVAGEGRSDHISGYMDGFNIWKQLFEAKKCGVIRGDEAFGCYPVKNKIDVYKNMHILVLSDYSNINDSVVSAFPDQKRPASLEQKTGENMEVWRDRLNTEFEIPSVFSALNDLKLAYVEIINPFFSRRIIKLVRQMPDHLRTNKCLFRNIVQTIGPDIKFAKYPAIARRKDILSERVVKDIIAENLNDTYTRNILPANLINHILHELKEGRTGNAYQVSQNVASIVGRIKKRLFKLPVKPVLDIHILAFRTYIISSMSRLLNEDALSLTKYHG